jgi:hypothetical protein
MELTEQEQYLIRTYLADATMRIQRELGSPKHGPDELLPSVLAQLISLAHMIATINLGLSEEDFIEACMAGSDAVSKFRN